LMHITPENLDRLLERITAETLVLVQKNCTVYKSDGPADKALRELMEDVIKYSVQVAIMIFIKSVQEKQEP